MDLQTWRAAWTQIMSVLQVSSSPRKCQDTTLLAYMLRTRQAFTAQSLLMFLAIDWALNIS